MANLNPSRGPRIDLERVSKRYRIGGGEVTALDDVSLHIDGAAFVVILGASGSGKTTLLNIIGALDTATAGSAQVDGTVITGASARRRAAFRRRSVSFIFQTFNLFPGLTALENVQFGADASRRPHPRAAALTAIEGTWVGTHSDSWLPISCAVQLIGSMAACASSGARYSAVIFFADDGASPLP